MHKLPFVLVSFPHITISDSAVINKGQVHALRMPKLGYCERYEWVRTRLSVAIGYWKIYLVDSIEHAETPQVTTFARSVEKGVRFVQVTSRGIHQGKYFRRNS